MSKTTMYTFIPNFIENGHTIQKLCKSYEQKTTYPRPRGHKKGQVFLITTHLYVRRAVDCSYLMTNSFMFRWNYNSCNSSSTLGSWYATKQPHDNASWI